MQVNLECAAICIIAILVSIIQTLVCIIPFVSLHLSYVTKDFDFLPWNRLPWLIIKKI